MSVDRLLSGIVALAAVTMTLLVARRELMTSTTSASRSIGTKFDKNWTSYRKAGRALGSQHAPVQILYFSELQCPFCRRFEGTLTRLDSLFPGKVGHTFIHFPLSIHAQAIAAATAVECAGAQERFEEMLAITFERQDSLASVNWTLVASQASVADTVAFRTCLSADWPRVNIDRGVSLGKEVGVRGTPTVFINGWRVDGVPPDSTFERIVRNLLRSGRPK